MLQEQIRGLLQHFLAALLFYIHAVCSFVFTFVLGACHARQLDNEAHKNTALYHGGIIHLSKKH